MIQPETLLPLLPFKLTGYVPGNASFPTVPPLGDGSALNWISVSL